MQAHKRAFTQHFSSQTATQSFFLSPSSSSRSARLHIFPLRRFLNTSCTAIREKGAEEEEVLHYLPRQTINQRRSRCPVLGAKTAPRGQPFVKAAPEATHGCVRGGRPVVGPTWMNESAMQISG